MRVLNFSESEPPPEVFCNLRSYIYLFEGQVSYLVLARKWRPKNFEEIVGQEHVVRTLEHALDNERLHHAYLFTGTRGVGKTTLARILAKALNCEKGVSSKPCNECPVCAEIDEGRFIDLIEVDAASRTKVEDTRALLDNVPYRATSGRYKVYLIDEIHMLSGHSFNALLKTLEEPPEHVKFLMATTDPQKLPVTILSRCIQFNLRAMDSTEISGQITKILEQEKIKFDTDAVDSIARLSHGSMRDGLSILDQAISYTHGNLEAAPVREMLGMLSHEFLFELLTAVANQNAGDILEIIARMSEQSVNYASALDDLLLKLHELSLLKIAPEIVSERADNLDDLKRVENLISKEEIQLYYQIGLIGKRDLPLAPDPRTGFEMILMRMLAFHPDSTSAAPSAKPKETPKPTAESEPGTAALSETPSPTASEPQPIERAAPPEPDSLFGPAVPEPQSPPPETSTAPVEIQTSEDWLDFVRNKSGLRGPGMVYAQNLSFKSHSSDTITLTASEDDPAIMSKPEYRENLEKILRERVNEKIELIVENGDNGNENLNQRLKREQTENLAEATLKIEQEEIPILLKQEFGATLDKVTLQPK